MIFRKIKEKLEKNKELEEKNKELEEKNKELEIKLKEIYETKKEIELKDKDRLIYFANEIIRTANEYENGHCEEYIYEYHPIFKYINVLTDRIQTKYLCELIENDFDSEYSNGKFRIKNIFPTEKNEGILLKNKNKIKIELGKDPTLSAPWKEKRLLKCFVTIGSEIKYIDKVYNIKEKATWKQDYQNHYSILYMPMGVTVIGNGNHSSATGILKKEGIIEINEIIDLSDTYDTIKFDGEYFINIESNEKICKPSFYEFGIIYEIGRLIKEKGINFKNYNEIIERL
ncbi:DUF6710 family protein [Clostridium baratii]|uniref:Uncharacterized protein n=1 Tax=Clostridium baratii TaxID=1561 RepID=A0A174V716_9CLOT|nr:DUF6710 family protein [Clostridium baratii]CUQ30544.1 Uncharacterised protein [Clostridium baratii]